MKYELLQWDNDNLCGWVEVIDGRIVDHDPDWAEVVAHYDGDWERFRQWAGNSARFYLREAPVT